MTTEKTQLLATEALIDLKAIDIVTIDVKEITTIADTFIICTGRSNRHVRSIAQSVVKKAKEANLSYINMEGEEEGEWIIVDLADVVIHVMQPATREFYNLEDLWEPVKELREKNR